MFMCSLDVTGVAQYSVVGITQRCDCSLDVTGVAQCGVVVLALHSGVIVDWMLQSIHPI